MEKTRREIMDRVYLTYLPAKKFKPGCLSAQFITPLRREPASCGALLPLVVSLLMSNKQLILSLPDSVNLQT